MKIVFLIIFFNLISIKNTIAESAPIDILLPAHDFIYFNIDPNSQKDLINILKAFNLDTNSVQFISINNTIKPSHDPYRGNYDANNNQLTDTFILHENATLFLQSLLDLENIRISFYSTLSYETDIQILSSIILPDSTKLIDRISFEEDSSLRVFDLSNQSKTSPNDFSAIEKRIPNFRRDRSIMVAKDEFSFNQNMIKNLQFPVANLISTFSFDLGGSRAYPLFDLISSALLYKKNMTPMLSAGESIVDVNTVLPVLRENLKEIPELNIDLQNDELHDFAALWSYFYELQGISGLIKVVIDSQNPENGSLPLVSLFKEQWRAESILTNIDGTIKLLPGVEGSDESHMSTWEKISHLRDSTALSIGLDLFESSRRKYGFAENLLIQKLVQLYIDSTSYPIVPNQLLTYLNEPTDNEHQTPPVSQLCESAIN